MRTKSIGGANFSTSATFCGACIPRQRGIRLHSVVQFSQAPSQSASVQDDFAEDKDSKRTRRKKRRSPKLQYWAAALGQHHYRQEQRIAERWNDCSFRLYKATDPRTMVQSMAYKPKPKGLFGMRRGIKSTIQFISNYRHPGDGTGWEGFGLLCWKRSPPATSACTSGSKTCIGETTVTHQVRCQCALHSVKEQRHDQEACHLNFILSSILDLCNVFSEPTFIIRLGEEVLWYMEVSPHEIRS